MRLPALLLAAAVVAPLSDELRPCPALGPEPIPVWMCLALGDGPTTEPDAAMQKELDAAWERFLDDANAPPEGDSGH